MKDVKIILKNVGHSETKLEFEREISLFIAGQIMGFIADQENREAKKKIYDQN